MCPMSSQDLVKDDPTVLTHRSAQGKTPLMWAAMGGYLEVVEYLVEQGAPLADKDRDQATVLHYAATYG